MGIYNDFFIPHLINIVMRVPMAAGERPGVVGSARGKVLEIGIGPGFNLPYYGPDVDQVLAIEPSKILRNKALDRAKKLGINLTIAGLDAMEMDIEDSTIDTIVITWVLCSIPEPEKAINEMLRVLKPEGRLLFIEHGLADKPSTARWQNRLNRPWRCCAGGCNINRKPDNLLAKGGFIFEKIEKGFADGPSILSFEYKGVARPSK
ncbi:MAG: class I SAM-dependent methyltransferase [Rhodospirillaceae bacterium]|nr:class I SAM-dependent methyltransferase [Rhodospirillaceae bacterium]